MGEFENASPMPKKHVLAGETYSLGEVILSKEGGWRFKIKNNTKLIWLQREKIT